MDWGGILIGSAFKGGQDGIITILDRFIPFKVTGRELEPIPAANGRRNSTPVGATSCSRAPRHCSEGVPAPSPAPTTGTTPSIFCVLNQKPSSSPQQTELPAPDVKACIQEWNWNHPHVSSEILQVKRDSDVWWFPEQTCAQEYYFLALWWQNNEFQSCLIRVICVWWVSTDPRCLHVASPGLHHCCMN